MEAGVALADWWRVSAAGVRHAPRITYRARAERLVEWVERHEGVATVRQLQQAKLYPTSTDAEAANALVAAGLGAWHATPTTPRGGRPSQIFRLFTAGAPVNETPADREES